MEIKLLNNFTQFCLNNLANSGFFVLKSWNTHNDVVFTLLYCLQGFEFFCLIFIDDVGRNNKTPLIVDYDKCILVFFNLGAATIIFH